MKTNRRKFLKAMGVIAVAPQVLAEVPPPSLIHWQQVRGTVCFDEDYRKWWLSPDVFLPPEMHRILEQSIEAARNSQP